MSNTAAPKFKVGDIVKVPKWPMENLEMLQGPVMDFNYHNCTYKSYLGLTEKYDFCTVCDAKKYN